MEHNAKAAVPVFPLPELVLFPGVIVPLHVFELRYRTMVRDVLSRDRVLAMAVLSPGYESDYHDSPAYHPIGCLGRIQEIEWLPDERYELKVVGETRVRFGRVAREFPYRAVDVDLLPQNPYAEDDPLVELDKAALLELRERLGVLAEAQGGEAAKNALPPVDPNAPYETLVNGLSLMCARSVDERLSLLAEDSVIERGRRVRETLERVLAPSGKSRPGGDRN